MTWGREAQTSKDGYMGKKGEGGWKGMEGL